MVKIINNQEIDMTEQQIAAFTAEKEKQKQMLRQMLRLDPQQLRADIDYILVMMGEIV